MQPETIKVNGQTLNGADIKKKEFSPTEQWDQLAFRVIYNELAPKGFKKLTSGAFKGQQIAVCAGPGLPKIKVTSAQRIAAQLVRGFREQAKKSIHKELDEAKIEFEKARNFSRECPWWRLKEWYKRRSKGEYWCALVDSYETLIEKLDNTPIQ